jgi:hypothetical protein
VHVRNWSSYQEPGPDGGFWVVGEVYNGLDEDVAYVNVTATLFNAANEPIDDQENPQTYSTCVTSIAAGTDSPFGVLFINPPAGIDHVEVQVKPASDPDFGYLVSSDDGFEPPVERVNISIDEPSFTDEEGFRHVQGTIINKSNNDTYVSTLACIALYDDQGRVVRMTSIPPTEDDYLDLGTTLTYSTDQSDELNVTGVTITNQRAWVEALYEFLP